MGKKSVWEAIDGSRERFVRLAGELWKHPEISFEEEKSAALHRQALRELGCDEAQGYHIARPMEAHQLEALLATSDSGYQLRAGRPSARSS